MATLKSVPNFALLPVLRIVADPDTLISANIEKRIVRADFPGSDVRHPTCHLSSAFPGISSFYNHCVFLISQSALQQCHCLNICSRGDKNEHKHAQNASVALPTAVATD